PMILWDKGKIRFLDGPAEEGIEKGKLDFELQGLKLHGRFALVRLKPKGPARKNAAPGRDWLLFKKKDPWSSTERNLITELPRSVLSGMTVEELAEAPRIAEALEAKAAALGAPERRLPPKITPMLCSTNQSALRGGHDGWLHELKLDGVRLIARKDGRD